MNKYKIDVVKFKYMILNDLFVQRFGEFVLDVKVIYNFDSTYTIKIHLVSSRQGLIQDLKEYLASNFGLDKGKEIAASGFTILTDLEYRVEEEFMYMLETLYRMRKG